DRFGRVERKRHWLRGLAVRGPDLDPRHERVESLPKRVLAVDRWGSLQLLAGVHHPSNRFVYVGNGGGGTNSRFDQTGQALVFLGEVSERAALEFVVGQDQLAAAGVEPLSLGLERAHVDARVGGREDVSQPRGEDGGIDLRHLRPKNPERRVEELVVGDVHAPALTPGVREPSHAAVPTPEVAVAPVALRAPLLLVEPAAADSALPEADEESGPPPDHVLTPLAGDLLDALPELKVDDHGRRPLLGVPVRTGSDRHDPRGRPVIEL